MIVWKEMMKCFELKKIELNEKYSDQNKGSLQDNDEENLILREKKKRNKFMEPQN